MAGREVKKLRRAELIEIIYQLKKSEQELQQENESLRQRLENREIKIAEAGSVAEAALFVMDTFGAAQKAADLYLAEIKRRHASADADCEELLAEARRKADAIVNSAVQQREYAMAQTKAAQEEFRKYQIALKALKEEWPVNDRRRTQYEGQKKGG